MPRGFQGWVRAGFQRLLVSGTLALEAASCHGRAPATLSCHAARPQGKGKIPRSPSLQTCGVKTTSRQPLSQPPPDCKEPAARTAGPPRQLPDL